MEYDSEYTIIIRNRQFLLNKSQIEFDSPNFFISCFLRDFSEAQSRTLKLSRDPDLFQVIVNYLCGYAVLPLSDDFRPAFMTPATVLTNLRTDAVFYQLDGLVEQCDALLKPQTPSTLPNQYLVLGSQYKHAEIEDIGSQMKAATHPLAWKTWVPPDALYSEPLVNLQRPESRTGFEALGEVAAVESFVLAQVPEYVCGAWRLVGWNVRKTVGSWDVSSQLVVVLERRG